MGFDRKGKMIFKELYTFTGIEAVILLIMDLAKKHRRNLEKRLQDPELRSNFEAESLRHESAVALLKAREDASLTQRELVRRVDMPQSTIARIERGKILVSIHFLK